MSIKQYIYIYYINVLHKTITACLKVKNGKMCLQCTKKMPNKNAALQLVKMSNDAQIKCHMKSCPSIGSFYYEIKDTKLPCHWSII